MAMLVVPIAMLAVSSIVGMVRLRLALALQVDVRTSPVLVIGLAAVRMWQPRPLGQK